MPQKIQWQYYFARKFSLQRFEVVLRVFISPFWKKHFRVNVKNMLIKPEEGGNHGIWMDPEEYPRAQQKVFNVVYKNLKNWHFYKRLIKRTQKQFVRETKKLARRVNPKLLDRTIADLHARFADLHQEHFNKPIWIPFATEPLISEAAERVLVSALTRTRKMNEYNDWFSVIFSPDQKNAITRAHEAILALALLKTQKKLNATKEKQCVRTIVAAYGWIPCYDVIDAPWDEARFASELKETLRKGKEAIQKELHELKSGFMERKKKFTHFLHAMPISARERELLIMAHDVVFIKDERDDYRREGSHAARPLFAEIGRRLGLTLRETCYLSIAETQSRLRKNTGPSNKEVRERVKGYLILQKFGKPYTIASGKEMEKILRRELETCARSVAEEAVGIPGSPGKASGKTVIVRTKHDLRRVFDNAIMIAVTTNPDFVPAMRKCKAIVTDEGGITAHAAIVSRELHIPCIVGTKIGTKIFKEGDLVDVDAYKGIIKKI